MACNITCFVRREEQYGVCKFFKLSQALKHDGLRSERNMLRNLFRSSSSSGERRQERSGRDTIDIDAMRPKFARQRLREQNDPGFGRSVGRASGRRSRGVMRRRAGTESGRDIDYLSIGLPHHMGRCGLHAKEDALQIHIQN